MYTKKFLIENNIPHSSSIFSKYPHSKDNRVWELSLEDIENIYKDFASMFPSFVGIRLDFDYMSNGYDGMVTIISEDGIV